MKETILWMLSTFAGVFTGYIVGHSLINLGWDWVLYGLSLVLLVMIVIQSVTSNKKNKELK